MKASDYLSRYELRYFTTRSDLYGAWLIVANWLIIAAVFAKEAGAPIPSPEAVLSPVTFVINTGAGLLAKTSMDGWNLIAPVIGLGDAALRY